MNSNITDPPQGRSTDDSFSPEVSVETFTRATEQTLDGLQLENVVGKINRLPAQEIVKSSLASIMSVKGNIEGYVVLSLSPETALGISEQLLGGTFGNEEISDSVVMELVNIIMGTAQVEFESKDCHYDFTIPSLIKGKDIRAPLDLNLCRELETLEFELVIGGSLYLQFFLLK